MAIAYDKTTNTNLVRCKYILGFLAYLYVMMLAYRISDNKAIIEELKTEKDAEIQKSQNELFEIKKSISVMNLEEKQQINDLQLSLSNIIDKIESIRLEHVEQLREMNNVIISQKISIQKYEMENMDLILVLKNLEKNVKINPSESDSRTVLGIFYGGKLI